MQLDEIKYNLKNSISLVEARRHRLVILIAKDDITNQVLNCLELKDINLNLLLSEKLLNVPVNKRSRAVGPLIDDIIKTNALEVLAITGYELLFLPELKQDPIRLFEELSKERTIVVIWKGQYDNGILTHAEPWHREYREYSNIDAEIIHT